MALIADVLMHGGLFGLFLIVFFYTFVVLIQQIAILRDIRNILDNYLQDIYLTSTELQRKSQLTAVNSFVANAATDANKEQSKLDEINKDISKKTFFMGVIPSIIAIVLAMLLTYFSGENLLLFILQNLITLSFIAVSEVVIVGLFLNSFAIVDGSFIKATYITQSHETNMKDCEYIDQWLKNHGLSQWA